MPLIESSSVSVCKLACVENVSMHADCQSATQRFLSANTPLVSAVDHALQMMADLCVSAFGEFMSVFFCLLGMLASRVSASRSKNFF